MNPNPNIEQSENQDAKKYNYIYFNFKQEKSKQYKIYLSSNYNASDTLELIEEKNLNDNFIVPLIVKVYRFKILPDLLKKKNEQDEFEIELIFEEENKVKHHYTIRFKYIDRDFYEYKLKIEGIDIIPLELDEQFDIYLEILKDKYKKNQKTKENEDFISSSLLFLKEKDNKYDLLFYFSIFLNCFATDFIQNHLLAFDPKKIKGIGEIPERRLKPIKNILNKFLKNPEQIHIKNENLRLETTKLFYSLALYFNLYFQKEKIKEMFGNDIICEHLFEKLLSYHEFFKDLIIPKDDIIKLIENAKKYEQILTLLFYLGNDCISFLEVVKETKDYIYKFQEKMNNDKKDNKDKELYDNRIDIEKYVKPKKEDNLSIILSLIEGLKLFVVNINSDMKLIKYSSLIIEKYSAFYEEIDIDKLIELKSIAQSINQIDPKFDCKCNLDEKIHRTGLKLINNRILKNMQILLFIKNDIYYLDKNHNKKKYRSLEILDGIDISLIGDKKNFFRVWNTINFYSMFDSQIEAFSKKISSLITEMKDFRYLFKFFQIGQEEPRKEAIKAMQNRFIEILPTYNNKICYNFIEDAVEIIFLSDKKKVDIKKFLSDIEKYLNVKIINDIYINLTEKHKDLSKECNKISVKYFTENKENSEPVSLAYLIDKCNNIRDDIFSNINNYALKEEDIFSQNETKNYIFFRELVNRKIIEKVQNKKQKYIVDTMKVITSFQQKIKDNEIQFNVLYPYFKEGGYTEEILKKKISIFFIMMKKHLLII